MKGRKKICKIKVLRNVLEINFNSNVILKKNYSTLIPLIFFVHYFFLSSFYFFLSNCYLFIFSFFLLFYLLFISGIGRDGVVMNMMLEQSHFLDVKIHFSLSLSLSLSLFCPSLLSFPAILLFLHC